MSGEVHDILSYSLGTIGVRADVALRVHSGEQELRAVLNDIGVVSRSGIRQLHDLLSLERETMDGLSFGNEEQRNAWSLHERIDEIAESCHAARLEVDVNCDAGVEDLPDSIRTTIHRCVQEAVSNVIRHAHATKVTISVGFASGDIIVQVCDDGIGAKGLMRYGHGLTLMRQRLAMINGSLDVVGSSAGGVSVRVRVPVDDSREGGDE